MADKELILNVKSNIKDAADDAEKLGSNLEDAGKKGKKGFQGIGSAVKGIGTALKAAGIGIVVALLAKLMEVFRQNQKVLDFFNIAMESLSIAFNDLFGFLENNVGKATGFFKDIFENPTQSIKDFGKAIKDNLIERFDSLLDTFGHLGKALGHLFKGEFAEAWGSVKDAGKESIDILTGVNNTVDKATDVIVKYTKEVVKNAKAIVELNKAAELAVAKNQQIIEQKDREAELQRQIRDDETKTFAERIKANQELKTILEDQEKAMLANAQALVDAAQAQKDKNASDENKIALLQAETEKEAVLAQITGFKSEQLTNQVALEKELLEAKNEVLASSLSGIELELAELEASYKLKLDMARKAGIETTALEKQFAKQKSDIVREQTNSQLEAFSQLAGSLGSLAGESKELAIAQAIIDTYLGANKAFAQGGTVGFITGAAVIAAGLANVKKIMEQDVGGGSGGSVSTPTAAAPRTEIQSGAFTLEGGIEPEPARAYVVSDDITDSQNKLANIRRRATI